MLVCLLLLFTGACLVSKEGKLRVPVYIIIAFGIYSVFLILGLYYDHNNPTIDIKFQFYAFLFYLFFVNAKDLNILKFLFILNAIVLVTYTAIYLGLLPNLWHQSIIGFRGRVYGPSIIPIVLISFYYLYHKMPFDFPLAISYAIAMPYLLLTTNLMNIVIAGVLLFLIIANLRKIFQPKFLFGVTGLLIGFFLLLNSSFAPELIKEKLPYVLKPLEYASLKIRVDDFNEALKVEGFTLVEKMFGNGFGASTTIYRENEKAQSWSAYFTFQEIDNGFYYLYHRGGYLLLIIFFVTHFYLLLKIPSIKAKLGFLFIVLFTCLLSIHYFNNVFYLLIPFLILESPTKEYSTNKNSIDEALSIHSP